MEPQDVTESEREWIVNLEKPGMMIMDKVSSSFTDDHLAIVYFS